jgi:hypothetical protein
VHQPSSRSGCRTAPRARVQARKSRVPSHAPKPPKAQKKARFTSKKKHDSRNLKFSIFCSEFSIFGVHDGVKMPSPDSMDWDQLVATQIVDLRSHPNLCPKSKITRVMHANASIFGSGVDFSRFWLISVGSSWNQRPQSTPADPS